MEERFRHLTKREKERLLYGVDGVRTNTASNIVFAVEQTIEKYIMDERYREIEPEEIALAMMDGLGDVPITEEKIVTYIRQFKRRQEQSSKKG